VSGEGEAADTVPAINDSPTHGVQIVPCRLVVRESTDPQAADVDQAG
jgi:hypothetical protein